MNKLLGILILLLVLVTTGSGLYINHLEKQLNEQSTTTETIVTVTQHDTVVVEKPAVIIYKTKRDTIWVNQPEIIDSLYQALADSVKNGYIPTAYDSTTFDTKDHLETWYSFPPENRFTYKFLAAPDSVIQTTITNTRIIDKTPPMSVYLGPRMIQYKDGMTSKLGGAVGLRIKNMGFELGYYETGDKIWGVNWYKPFKLF